MHNFTAWTRARTHRDDDNSRSERRPQIPPSAATKNSQTFINSGGRKLTLFSQYVINAFRLAGGDERTKERKREREKTSERNEDGETGKEKRRHTVCL